jgi:hypothetical protein
MKREIRQISGLFLALLALVAQLTLATAVPATTVSLADVTRVCQHGGHAGAPPVPANLVPANRVPAHQMPDCQMCLVCHGLSGPPGLLAAALILPASGRFRIARAAILSPATAPPARFATAARPRGPPIPV